MLINVHKAYSQGLLNLFFSVSTDFHCFVSLKTVTFFFSVTKDKN